MVAGLTSQRFGQTVLAQDILFCSFDAKSLCLIEVSTGVSDALGYSADKLQSMTLRDLMRPEDDLHFQAALDELDDNFTDAGLWELRRHSGAWWPVEMRWRRDEDADSRVVVAVLHDASRLIALQHERDKLARRLNEREATLRMARHQLGIGIGKMEVESGRMVWSDSANDIHGVSSSDSAGDLHDYLGIIHPDDRAEMLAECEAFHVSEAGHLEMCHRILRPDGETIHVRGVAIEEQRGDHVWLSGVFQDISEEVHAKEKLSEASRMQRIAGRVARLGGWRTDLDPRSVIWSGVTAAIHGEREGFSPSFEQWMSYYTPECRERIREAHAACAQSGQTFDDVLQLVTAQGNCIWVRTIGEAVRDEHDNIIALEGAIQDISELVAARDKSENLSRRLQYTLESISEAFFLLDDDCRFTFLNSQAEAFLQKCRGDLLGKSIWQEFPDSVGSLFHMKYERAVIDGHAIRCPEFFPALDTWFEINAYPTSEGMAVYFRDITQDRARKEQLRLLEMAVSRQNDILLITEAAPIYGPDGPKIVYVNDAFERRTGFSREEVIGQTPRLLQGPKTDRTELDRIRHALEKWHPVRSELINYKKSGEEFWIEIDIVPLADEKGTNTHWVAIERDITDRKRIEQESYVNQERFRLVARATNDVIWDWDLTAGTIWWNENLQSLFGHDPASLEPGVESWTNHIHPEDKDRVLSSIDALTAGAETTWTEEYRFLSAKGHPVTVIDRAFVIRDTEGTAIRMLGSIIDVSDQREMESRLRQAQKLEVVGQLTGGIAHDFNNLLTIILGNAETLSEALGDHDSLHMLAVMTVTAAERGAELTNRLLSFSRKQALQPQVLNVSSLIHGMEELLQRTLPESINIHMVGTEGLWQVEIDIGQLESALLNLALNARDAMPDGGHLTIEMMNSELDEKYVAGFQDLAAGHYVMIAVTDTGEGIAPCDLGRVFEPFFTTKDVGKGSGLGLSMVYGFVKQSGGHIRVHSELGQGSSVKLYFPRAHGQTAQSRVHDEGIVITNGTESILVVEDDQMVREHLVARLVGLGYKVISVESGPSALKIIEQMPDLDLLFTDMVLPGGMNGRALADTAQALRPKLKVLFTTGYSEAAIVHHGRLDPGVELLGKPYRRDQLAAKLRKVLDKV